VWHRRQCADTIAETLQGSWSEPAPVAPAETNPPPPLCIDEAPPDPAPHAQLPGTPSGVQVAAPTVPFGQVQPADHPTGHIPRASLFDCVAEQAATNPAKLHSRAREPPRDLKRVFGEYIHDFLLGRSDARASRS